jgi:hypothetical protein
MTTRHRVARGLTLSTAACLAVGAAAVAGTSTAAADSTVDRASGATSDDHLFAMGAQAVALQSTTTDPSVPLGLPFSGGSYGASADLDSNGESSADAGAPYSPLVSSLPHTGNGVAQSTFGASLPVVPSFPGYVAAKDPVVPISKQTAGGYELTATATPDQARGNVSIGGQAAVSPENNAFAFANSLLGKDGGVLAEGASGVHALTLGGVLDLANVSSYASLSQAAAGVPVATTTTSLGTISFAGLSSGLTGDGFTTLGSAPTPVSTQNLAALNGALKPTGIVLTYLPALYTFTDGSTSTGPTIDPKKVVAGVTSGALRIFLSNTSARGLTTQTITLGRVSVAATSRVLDGRGPVDLRAPGAIVPAAAALDRGLDAAASPVEVGGNESRAAAPAPTMLISPVSTRSALRTGPSVTSNYLMLVLAAGGALLCGQLARLIAVRKR